MHNDRDSRVFDHINDIEDLKIYFTATPYTATLPRQFGGLLDHDYFIEHFYSRTMVSENYIESFIKKFLYNTRKTYIFHGYMGCGKTTFLRQLEAALIIKKHPVFFIDLGVTSPQPTVESLRLAIAGCFYETINGYCYDSWNKLLNFYNKYSLEVNDVDYDINDPASFGGLGAFFSTLKTCLETKNDSPNLSDLGIHKALRSLSIRDLFLVLSFLQIGEYLENRNRKALFVLDNMDVIDNTEVLHSFRLAYGRFSTVVGKLLGSLSLKTYMDVIGSTNCFLWAFGMRDYTSAAFLSHTAAFLSHTEDSGRMMTEEVPLNSVYDHTGIIRERVHFLLKFENRIKPAFFQRARLLQFLIVGSTDVISIFSHFNNNYRQCVMTLADIIDDVKNIIALRRFVELCSASHRRDRNLMRGARGIIYRLLIDVLRQEKFYDSVGASDFNGYFDNDEYRSPRIVLTILQNKTAPHSLIDENGDMTLYALFSFLDKIYCSADDFIEKIFHMYVHNGHHSNSFITFTYMKSQSGTALDFSSLRTDLDAYNNNIKPGQKLDDGSCYYYDRIQITPSGKFYLSETSRHFEFFSARCSKTANMRPLFCIEFDDDGLQELRRGLSCVFDNVIKCCRRVNRQYEKAYGKSFLYLENQDFKADFLHSYTKKQEYGFKVYYPFHGERIVITHIGYLESYRQYMLSTIEGEPQLKKRFNTLLVKTIEKYCLLVLGDDGFFITDDNRSLLRDFLSLIQKIEDGNFDESVSSIMINSEYIASMTQRSY